MKLLSLTAFILIVLAGPAAWFATNWIDSPETGHGPLFATAWVFAGLGIVAGTVLIACAPSFDEFGSPKLMSALFGAFTGVLAAIAFVVGVLGAIFYGIGTDQRLDASTWDTNVYVTFVVATLAGYVLSFFLEFFLFADESWAGQVSTRNSSRLKRVV